MTPEEIGELVAEMHPFLDRIKKSISAVINNNGSISDIESTVYDWKAKRQELNNKDIGVLLEINIRIVVFPLSEGNNPTDQHFSREFADEFDNELLRGFGIKWGDDNADS